MWQRGPKGEVSPHPKSKNLGLPTPWKFLAFRDTSLGGCMESGETGDPGEGGQPEKRLTHAPQLPQAPQAS